MKQNPARYSVELVTSCLNVDLGDFLLNETGESKK